MVCASARSYSQGRVRLNLSHTAVSEIHTSFISDFCFPPLSYKSFAFLIRTFLQYCAFLPSSCDAFMGKNKHWLSVLNTLNETESAISPPKRDDGHPYLFLPPPVLLAALTGPGGRFLKVPVTFRARNQILKSKYKE